MLQFDLRTLRELKKILKKEQSEIDLNLSLLKTADIRDTKHVKNLETRLIIVIRMILEVDYQIHELRRVA